MARIELDFKLVLGFANLDAASDPGHRNRVATGMQSDVAFDIDDAFMEKIDLGNSDRKRFQLHPFDGEQLTWNGRPDQRC